MSPNPTPAHGKPAPQPAAATPRRPRRNTTILIGVAAAVLLALVVWWLLRDKGPPRLNASTTDLTRFAATDRFEKLPFDQQRQYMDVLDSRGKELDQAHQAGKISDDEYRKGLELAWFGKQLSRMDKYYALPQGQQRDDYIARLVEKKEKDPKSDAADADSDPDEIARDEKTEKSRPKTWPADLQDQWKQFRKAYRDAKKTYEKASKPPASSPAIP